MKSSTSKAVAAILSADETISTEQTTTALTILNERPIESGVTPSLIVNQAEAARLLSVSRITIYRLVRDGKLKPVNLTSGARRYNRSELERIAKEGL